MTREPGLMETSDLAAYTAPLREPTVVDYRGLTVYGMAPPSSGGSTVGEALNILDNVNLGAMTRTQALHHYFEASALAYADRGAYVADPSAMTASLDELLSQGFADERYCEDRPCPRDDQADGRGQPRRLLRHRLRRSRRQHGRRATARGSRRRT